MAFLIPPENLRGMLLVANDTTALYYPPPGQLVATVRAGDYLGVATGDIFRSGSETYVKLTNASNSPLIGHVLNAVIPDYYPEYYVLYDDSAFNVYVNGETLSLAEYADEVTANATTAVIPGFETVKAFLGNLASGTATLLEIGVFAVVLYFLWYAFTSLFSNRKKSK